MRRVVFALVVAACASEAAAQTSPPAWLRKPTAEEVAGLYPKAAVPGRVTGSVLLQCRVTTKGLLEGCQAEQETPAGYDFAPAAIRMSRLFELSPATRDGVPVEWTVRVPVNFAAPKDDPAAKPKRRIIIIPIIIP